MNINHDASKTVLRVASLLVNAHELTLGIGDDNREALAQRIQRQWSAVLGKVLSKFTEKFKDNGTAIKLSATEEKKTVEALSLAELATYKVWKNCKSLDSCGFKHQPGSIAWPMNEDSSGNRHDHPNTVWLQGWLDKMKAEALEAEKAKAKTSEVKSN